MIGPIAEFIFDGDPLWIYTVEQGVDWNEVSFRRGFQRCPECFNEDTGEGEACNDVTSIFPQSEVGPDEYGLHWCPCGCIWRRAYNETHILMSSKRHVGLRADAEDRRALKEAGMRRATCVNCKESFLIHENDSLDRCPGCGYDGKGGYGT